MNVFFAVADFCTQVVLVIVGIALVLDPELLVDQIDFGTTPTVSDFLIAIPVGMVAYTGIETISNLAEEARDVGKTIPRGMGLVVIAVVVIYAFLPAVALSAMPVINGETVLAKPKEEGGFADDPILGRGREHGSRQPPGAGRGLRRHPGRHDPLDRDERRHARRLAADVLDGPAPPAAGVAARAAPEVPHALRRDRGVRRDRVRGDPARPGGLPRGDLRLRGDALVHDGARVRGGPALEAARHRTPMAQPGLTAVARA